MKWVLKSGIVFSLLLSLLLSQSGCTYALWTNGQFDASKEPAPTADLQLYHSTKKNDILVVYNEESERSGSIHSRAYWLNKNRARVERCRAPKFVQKKTIPDLSPVPIYSSTPEITGTNLYAVYGADRFSFTLCSGGQALSSYQLPVYNDSRGLTEKILLTPIAVSGDLGTGLFIVSLYCLLYSSPDGLGSDETSSHGPSGYHVGR